MLMKKGADYNMKNERGETPLAIVKKCPKSLDSTFNLELEKLLKDEKRKVGSFDNITCFR